MNGAVASGGANVAIGEKVCLGLPIGIGVAVNEDVQVGACVEIEQGVAFVSVVGVIGLGLERSLSKRSSKLGGRRRGFLRLRFSL